MTLNLIKMSDEMTISALKDLSEISEDLKKSLEVYLLGCVCSNSTKIGNFMDFVKNGDINKLLTFNELCEGDLLYATLVSTGEKDTWLIAVLFQQACLDANLKVVSVIKVHKSIEIIPVSGINEPFKPSKPFWRLAIKHFLKADKLYQEREYGRIWQLVMGMGWIMITVAIWAFVTARTNVEDLSSDAIRVKYIVAIICALIWLFSQIITKIYGSKK